jgi:hypothetical protein
VSDYNGRSLNSGDEHSQMFIDFDCSRATELRKWWSSHKRRNPLEFQSITGGLMNSLLNPVPTIGSKD